MRGALPPVRADCLPKLRQDLFPSPSPPPPPFTAAGFGLDMLNAALMGDASKGSKTLNGAAKVGMGYGMGKARRETPPRPSR